MTLARKNQFASSSYNEKSALPLHHHDVEDKLTFERVRHSNESPKVITATLPRQRQRKILWWNRSSSHSPRMNTKPFVKESCQSKVSSFYRGCRNVRCSREYLRTTMRRMWSWVDYCLFFSKLTRLLIWSLALITMFTMERRRTFQRMKDPAVRTRVISGMLVETPDDLQFDAAKIIPSSILPVPTQRNPIQDEQIKICSDCQIHYPYCDLQEFAIEQHQLAPNYKLRLKQVYDDDFHTSEQFGLLTQRGIGTSHLSGNMDRTILIKPYHPLGGKDTNHWSKNYQYSGKEDEDEKDFLLLLLDGHGPGGADVAQWAMRNAPIILTNEVNKAWESIHGTSTQLHQLITQVMTRTFHKVHDGIAAQLLDHSPSEQHQKGIADEDALLARQLVSGTSLCLAFQWNEMLHIANVGESQAFVVSYDRKEAGKVKFIYATRPDKIKLPNERQRIIDKGGSLWLPSDPKSDGPRIFLQLPKANITTSDTIKEKDQNTKEKEKNWEKQEEQEDDTMDFVLGVSRSLGDLAAHEMGVISEPMVASVPLKPHDENTDMFIMMASNGLLDKMAPLTMAKRFAENFSFQHRMQSPVEIMEGIFLDANIAWKKSRVVKNGDHLVEYRDDVTLAVVRLG
mmetsp:Transcript_24349/g.36116  ORF Transcript_24349/g.36116 Transcript_24349/m.36116 type:complete len:625 (-) Transcript_24349:95-1969(-)